MFTVSFAGVHLPGTRSIILSAPTLAATLHSLVKKNHYVVRLNLILIWSPLCLQIDCGGWRILTH